jgi:hypothetical protein
MNKYCKQHKVGDEVIIADIETLRNRNNIINSTNHAGYTKVFENFSGKKMHIKEFTNSRGFYLLKEDPDEWSFEDACFADYNPDYNKTDSTKENIKMEVGDVVEVIRGKNVPIGTIGKIIGIDPHIYFRKDRGETTQCRIKADNTKIYITYICNLKKIESKKFWVVWNESTGKTTFKHPKQEKAQKEAERLANENINTTFYVLESVSVTTSNKTITKEII